MKIGFDFAKVDKIACPNCHAMAGASCRNIYGYPRTYHAERIHAGLTPPTMEVIPIQHDDPDERTP